MYAHDHAHNEGATNMKRAANLSVDAALLDEAKEMKINLSQTLEEALRLKVRAQKGEEWLRENHKAIESSNKWVEEHGLPLAKYRQF